MQVQNPSAEIGTQLNAGLIQKLFTQELTQNTTTIQIFVGALSSAPKVESSCPFKFLSAFSPEDADRLYGRDWEIRTVMNSLESQKMTIINGASGCGKSSLLQAGIIPKLSNHQQAVVYIKDYGQQGHTSLKETLDKVIELNRVNSVPVVVILDQFERFFKFTPNLEERRNCARQINAILSDAFLSIRLVIAIRHDFLGTMSLEFSPIMPDLFQYRLEDLNWLSLEGAREAVIKPFSGDSKVKILPTFVETLLADLKKDGFVQPAQLQIVCYELYKRALDSPAGIIEQGLIPDCKSIVEALLQNYLNDKVQAYDPHKDLVKAVLKQMVSPALENEHGNRDLRLFVTEKKLKQKLQNFSSDEKHFIPPVLERLHNDRLIEKRQHPHEELAEIQFEYSLVHEALIPQVSQWYSVREIELKRLRDQLDIAISTNKTDPLGLSAAQNIFKNKAILELDSIELSFVEVSLDEHRKRSFLLKSLIVLASLFLIGTAFFAWNSTKQSSTLNRTSTENYFSNAIASRNNGDWDSSLLLLSKSLERQLNPNYALAFEHTLSKLASFRHDSAIKGAVFSKDESKILTWSEDGLTQLWDVKNGKPLLIHPIQQDIALKETKFTTEDDNPDGAEESEKAKNGAMFSETESKILTWGGNTAQFWDAKSGKPLFSKPLMHSAAVRGAIFSKDESTILTWSEDGTVKLWNAKSGNPLFSKPLMHSAAIRGAIFSRDESKILTWTKDGIVTLWNTKSGEPLFSKPLMHSTAVRGAIFSKDESKILAWGRIVFVLDAKSGKSLLSVPYKQSHFVLGATFSKDETKILTWSNEGTAQLWDIKKSNPLFSHPLKYLGTINGVRFSKNGNKVLIWSYDGTAQLWDIKTGKPLLRSVPKHQAPINGAVFSKDESKILTWSEDGAAQLWDGENGTSLLSNSLKHSNGITGAKFSKDESKILTWSEDGAAQLWNLKYDKPLLSISLKPLNLIDGAVFSKDGSKIFISSADGTVQLWDAKSGKHLLPNSLERQSTIRDAEISKDESKITFLGDSRSSPIWDAKNYNILLPNSIKHLAFLKEAVFSKDKSKILTWSYEGTAQLWDAKTGKPLIPKFLEHEGTINTAVLSKDESKILTCSDDKTAQVWDVKTGKPLLSSVPEHPDRINGAIFSKDESKILTWSYDGTAQLWDTKNGKPLLSLPMKHLESIDGAIFSKDESKILTWSEDGTVKVWDISLPTAWKTTPWLLKAEVITGNTITDDGIIMPLSSIEHNARKKEYYKF